MESLDYAIITSTVIVSFIGLAVAIHTFLGTRKLYPVPDKPTPAPKRKISVKVIENTNSKNIRDFDSFMKDLETRYIRDPRTRDSEFCLKAEISLFFRINIDCGYIDSELADSVCGFINNNMTTGE